MPAASVTPSYLSRSTSNFAPGYSPGGSHILRSSEDELLVLDIGARYLRGGFSSEAHPRCTLEFNPEGERRVGDYRGVIPIQLRSEDIHGPKRPSTISKRNWAKDFTLWTNDLRDADLGLVEDRLERLLRKAYNEYFLLDKPRKVLLAADSLMPRPLLAAVLKILFTNFGAPAVGLMSPAVLAAVAAGVRSAVVVDIGWEETKVTAVSEYREVARKASVRAGREVSWSMREALREWWIRRKQEEQERGEENTDKDLEITFEQADEVLQRMGWCMTEKEALEYHSRSDDEPRTSSTESDSEISITLANTFPPVSLSVPFSALSHATEDAFFSPGSSLQVLDTHNQPLDQLLYSTLLALDVVPRDICMSRIIITGGCSSIPGLKTRLLSSLSSIVSTRGWDAVHSYGKLNGHQNSKPRSGDPKEALSPITNDASRDINSTDRSTAADAGSAEEQRPRNFSRPMGPVLPHLSLTAETQRLKVAEAMAPVTGEIRGLNTLGVWAGGSLVSALRITGKVEIERERYLREGITCVGGVWS